MITSIAQAKLAIINFNTLPSQIDYVAPYKRMNNEAEEFLNTLPEEEKNSVWAEINNTIDSYYAEDEGGISQADRDNQF